MEKTNGKGTDRKRIRVAYSSRYSKAVRNQARQELSVVRAGGNGGGPNVADTGGETINPSGQGRISKMDMEQAAKDERVAIIRKVADQLSDMQKLITVLRYVEQLNVFEIAKVVGKKPSDVYAILEDVRQVIFPERIN